MICHVTDDFRLRKSHIVLSANESLRDQVTYHVEDCKVSRVRNGKFGSSVDAVTVNLPARFRWELLFFAVA